MTRGATPDWKQEEFDRLAELILNTVADGGTVVEGITKFVDENSVRSISGSRYKWVKKLSKEYAEAYEAAREQGNKILAQRAKQDNVQSQQPVSRIGRAIKGSRVVPLRNDSDDAPNMTKRELIRFLRNVNIVGDEENETRSELERMRKENADMNRELSDFKHKYLLLEKKYEELEHEHETMLAAFNIARRKVAGVDDVSPRAQMIIGKDGVLQKVQTE